MKDITSREISYLSAAVDRFGGEYCGPQANDLSLMPRGEADAAARLPESPARQCYIKTEYRLRNRPVVEQRAERSFAEDLLLEPCLGLASRLRHTIYPTYPL